MQTLNRTVYRLALHKQVNVFICCLDNIGHLFYIQKYGVRTAVVHSNLEALLEKKIPKISDKDIFLGQSSFVDVDVIKFCIIYKIGAG